MCQVCKEKNLHYIKIIKKTGHSTTAKFWGHQEIFHVAFHDKLKAKLSCEIQKPIVYLMSSSSRMKFFYTCFKIEKTKEMIGRFIYIYIYQPWFVVEDPDF